MVETTKNPGDKTLSVTPTKTLTLKPRGVEQGVVRQSFSHGRTKPVLVEKVKRRAGGPTRAEAAPATDGLTAKRATSGRAPAAQPAVSSEVGSKERAAGKLLRGVTRSEGVLFGHQQTN